MTAMSNLMCAGVKDLDRNINLLARLRRSKVRRKKSELQNLTGKFKWRTKNSDGKTQDFDWQAWLINDEVLSRSIRRKTHRRRPTWSPPASPSVSRYGSCCQSCPRGGRGRQWFLKNKKRQRINVKNKPKHKNKELTVHFPTGGNCWVASAW